MPLLSVTGPSDGEGLAWVLIELPEGDMAALGVWATVTIDSREIERARRTSLFTGGTSVRGKDVERQAYITNPVR